jgi:hypothetical protein
MNWLQYITGLWIEWLDQITQPSNYTVVETSGPNTISSPITQVMANTTSGSFTDTLQTAATQLGYSVRFVNIGSGTLTVAVQSGDSLQGTLNGTITLGAGESITLISDGSAGYWQQQ